MVTGMNSAQKPRKRVAGGDSRALRLNMATDGDTHPDVPEVIDPPATRPIREAFLAAACQFWPFRWALMLQKAAPAGPLTPRESSRELNAMPLNTEHPQTAPAVPIEERKPTMVDEMQQKLEGLTARRVQLDAAIRALPTDLSQGKNALERAIAERDRLVNVVSELSKPHSEHKPPYEDLGRATSAMEQARLACRDAQDRLAVEQPKLEAEMRAVDIEIADIQRKIADTQLRQAVSEFEGAVRGAQLMQRSEEIRRLAKAAAVLLEERSPLLDPKYLAIANYPIQWR